MTDTSCLLEGRGIDAVYLFYTISQNLGYLARSAKGLRVPFRGCALLVTSCFQGLLCGLRWN